MNGALLLRTVLTGVVVATLAALGYRLALPLLGVGSALRLLIAGVAVAALIDLWSLARPRAGRLLVLAAAPLLPLLLLVSGAAPIVWLLALASALWLLRAGWLFRRPLPALLDAGAWLGALAIAAAVASATASVWLSVWCLWLIAGFAAALLCGRETGADAGTEDRYTAARRAADAALSALADTPTR